MQIKKATFKHVEAELYNLKNSWDEFYERIQVATDGDEARSEQIIYTRKRLRFIGRLFDAISNIEKTTNDTVKQFIKKRYFENKSLDQIEIDLKIDQKKLKEMHKLIVHIVGGKLGFDTGYKDGKEMIEHSRYIPSEIKKRVLLRDGRKCKKCGSEDDLHFHHVYEYSKGGLHEVDNLILLCSSCHKDEHKKSKAYPLFGSDGE